MKNVERWANVILVILLALLCFYLFDKLNSLEKRKADLKLRSLNLLDKRQKLNIVIKNLTEECDELNKDIRLKYMQMKVLVEETRKSIVRIKNLPEKKDENVYEKVLQVSELLDVELNKRHIEKVYRMNAPTKSGHKTLVVQLSDKNIAKKLVEEASKSNGKFEFSIQTDLSSYMLPYQNLINESTLVATNEKITEKKKCGIIIEIGQPQSVTRWNDIYGAWMRDFTTKGKRETWGPFWVMGNFENNLQLKEYSNMRNLIRKKSEKIYQLPYEWAGTGHVVLNNSLFYNIKNSNKIIKYNMIEKKTLVEKSITAALYGNQAPYQWLGNTDIDLSYDEEGLWAIYATHENAQDIVLSKIDVDTLEIKQTWITNWRKQWCSNAFMACGILYTLKKYDVKNTALGFTYDTHTKRYKHKKIPFNNKYGWNTMLSYNPTEKRLYAWDNGYLVYYDVIMNTTNRYIS